MAKAVDVFGLAEAKLGQPVQLGALVPKNNSRWRGPWDSVEFASWLVFQVTGRLIGCRDNHADPSHADAQAGFWRRDAMSLAATIPVNQAAAQPGVFVVRFTQSDKIGHIAVSDGDGGTIEAMSRRTGVCRARLDGRRWDVGIRLPWLEFARPPATPAPPAPPRLVLRVGVDGDLVGRVQSALLGAGFDPGAIDGEFGPQTLIAVRAFQGEMGLVTDGEVGVQTLRALGLESHARL